MKSTKPVSPVHVQRGSVQIHLDRERALTIASGAASVGMVRSDRVFLTLKYFLMEILNVF